MGKCCTCAVCSSPELQRRRLHCEVDQFVELVRDGEWRHISVETRVRIVNEGNERARKVGASNAV